MKTWFGNDWWVVSKLVLNNELPFNFLIDMFFDNTYFLLESYVTKTALCEIGKIYWSMVINL